MNQLDKNKRLDIIRCSFVANWTIYTQVWCIHIDMKRLSLTILLRSRMSEGNTKVYRKMEDNMTHNWVFCCIHRPACRSKKASAVVPVNFMLTIIMSQIYFLSFLLFPGTSSGYPKGQDTGAWAPHSLPTSKEVRNECSFYRLFPLHNHGVIRFKRITKLGRKSEKSKKQISPHSYNNAYSFPFHPHIRDSIN